MKILQPFLNLFKRRWAVTYAHGIDTVTEIVYANTANEAAEMVKKKYLNDCSYFYIHEIKKI